MMHSMPCDKIILKCFQESSMTENWCYVQHNNDDPDEVLHSLS